MFLDLIGVISHLHHHCHHHHLHHHLYHHHLRRRQLHHHHHHRRPPSDANEVTAGRTYRHTVDFDTAGNVATLLLHLASIWHPVMFCFVFCFFNNKYFLVTNLHFSAAALGDFWRLECCSSCSHILVPVPPPPSPHLMPPA